MQNPFSNRTTTSSSDYIQKKRNLTKIAFLKEMPYKNFKTGSYVCCDSNKCLKIQYKTPPKKAYPAEPEFPYARPHQHDSNLHYHNEMEDYLRNNQTPIAPSNTYSLVTCERCNHALHKMDYPPS